MCVACWPIRAGTCNRLVDLGLPVEHLLMQHAHVALLPVAVVLAAEQLLPLRSAKAPLRSGALCVDPYKGCGNPVPPTEDTVL